MFVFWFCLWRHTDLSLGAGRRLVSPTPVPAHYTSAEAANQAYTHKYIHNSGGVLQEDDRTYTRHSNLRSSRVDRAFDCQCRSRNSPGFDPSILRHRVESEGRQMKLCWIRYSPYIEKKSKKSMLTWAYWSITQWSQWYWSAIRSHTKMSRIHNNALLQHVWGKVKVIVRIKVKMARLHSHAKWNIYKNRHHSA